MQFWGDIKNLGAYEAQKVNKVKFEYASLFRIMFNRAFKISNLGVTSKYKVYLSSTPKYLFEIIN